MSRTINFDLKTIIEIAMQTFWINGLKTTLKEIEASTGLNKSSIYNTLGNKEEVFDLAMMCYVENMERWINEGSEGIPFREFIKKIIDDAVTDNFRGRGCFFYNCLGDKSVLNKKYKKTLDLAYIRVRTIFEHRIELAKKNQELNSELHTLGYATLLMSTIAGLRGFNISGMPKEDLSNAALTAFQKLC